MVEQVVLVLFIKLYEDILQVGKDLSLLSGVSEEQIRTAIDRYTSNLNTRNIDRVYDELSANEIDTIFKSIEKSKETFNGKSGFDDCMQDAEARFSTEEGATKTVKKAVLNINEVLNVNEHNIQE